MAKKCGTQKEINILYKKLIGKSRKPYYDYEKKLIKKYGYSCFRDIQKKSFKKISER